ncbi:MAG: glycosyltransferase family 2 protein [Anaerolineae bacterium]|nr:glycosyltransferase family 2 protein [Anaerolineae bacterium]
MPRVSILMSVHNGETHLPLAIESILAQTWPDWELILIDDASTDATPALLASLVAQDERLRCFRNDETWGSPAP